MLLKIIWLILSFYEKKCFLVWQMKKKLIQFETNSNKTVNVLINEEVSVFFII